MQTAIAKGHGSHTAKWLTSTAAACLEFGLKTSPSGLQLKPVSCQRIAVHLKSQFQRLDDLIMRLNTSTGQKYFTLLGPLQMPTLVLVQLHSIVLSSEKTASVLALLQSIQTITSDIGAGKQPLLPAGSEHVAHCNLQVELQAAAHYHQPQSL